MQSSKVQLGFDLADKWSRFNLYYFSSISKFAQLPTTACCWRGYEEGYLLNRFIG